MLREPRFTRTRDLADMIAPRRHEPRRDRPLSKSRKAALDALKASARPLTVRQVGEAIGRNATTASNALRALVMLDLARRLDGRPATFTATEEAA